MDYDYEGITQVKHDRAAKKLELTVRGKEVTVYDVEELFTKLVPFIDDKGTMYFNNARMSIKGKEAAIGD